MQRRKITLIGCCLLSCFLSVPNSLSQQVNAITLKQGKKGNLSSAKPALAKAILGIWMTTVPKTEGGTGGKVTFTFKPDGTLQQLLDGNGHHVRIRATYKIEKDLMTEKFVDALDNGKKMSLSIPEPPPFKVRVVGDKLYMDPVGLPDSGLVFSRVKK